MVTIDYLVDKAFEIDRTNKGSFTESEIADFYTLTAVHPQTSELEAVEIMIDKQTEVVSTTSTTSPWQSFKAPCHKPTTVYTHPTSKGSITLCNKFQVMTYEFLEDIDVLIPLDSLGGNIWKKWGNKVEGDKWDKIIDYVPIEDFGVLSKDAYERAIVRIKNYIVEGRKVLIFCIGGHGRTGYLAGGILGLLGLKDPIETMRENYCKSAVETFEQMEEISSFVNNEKFMEKWEDKFFEDDFGYPVNYGNYGGYNYNSTTPVPKAKKSNSKKFKNLKVGDELLCMKYAQNMEYLVTVGETCKVVSVEEKTIHVRNKTYGDTLFKLTPLQYKMLF